MKSMGFSEEGGSIQGELFARFPRRPYCYAHKADRRRIASLVRARGYPYIQPNPPSVLAVLPFDLDRPCAATVWDDVLAPPPTAIVARRDRDNSAHYLYGLKIPVKRADCATNTAAERYAAAIELGLTRKLGADLAYSGDRVKTPDHPMWRTLYGPQLYDLEDLAGWITLPRLTARTALRTTTGRNCTLFDRTRLSAMGTLHTLPGAPDIATRDWREVVEVRALTFNGDFAIPLSYPEVRHTAKSIADYTLSHERAYRAAMAMRQSWKGRKSGAARRARATSLIEVVRRDYRGED